MTQTERGTLLPTAEPTGSAGGHPDGFVPVRDANSGDRDPDPRSVCVTQVSDPRAPRRGLRPTHQDGDNLPPFLPDRSADAAAFDREGSDQLGTATNGTATAPPAVPYDLREAKGNLLSSTGEGRAVPILNDKARAAHLCGERRAGQGGSS